MEFHSLLNMRLEALAYLGRRAGGYDTAWMLERLRSRGVEDTRALEQRAEPIRELTVRLDEAVQVEPERLKYLFDNLPGFPYNTIGSYSRAFLLLYPMACDRMDLASPTSESSRERLAGELALMLDIAEESGTETRMPLEELTNRVLKLSIPAESKVAVLELCHDGGALAGEIRTLTDQVIDHLRREEELLRRCTEPFRQELEQYGPETVLSRTAQPEDQPKAAQRVVPFVFGMDTLLTSLPTGGEDDPTYCGVLRLPLQTALAGARGPEAEVYEAIKLLADQTRFDILCYLRDHAAYGQELAVKFGLSRNTIHHHMTKLLAAQLVKCTVDGNRVYYRVDEKSVERLLRRQRQLLLPGK